MDAHTLESRFVLVALLSTIAVVFFMVQPYLALLILAMVLAVIFEPLHVKLLSQLRSPSLAAFLTTLVVLALVLLPLLLFGYQLIQESASLYGYLADRTGGNGLALALDQIQTWISTLAPGFELDTADIIRFVQSSLGVLLSNVGFVFAGFARVVIGFLLLLLVFFYLVRDGRKLKKRLIKLSPLSDKHEKEIIATLEQSIHAVVRGSLVIALIQGLVAGIGFTLFGVPNPALWAGVLIIASFVPTIGTSLVQAPIIAYIFLTGQVEAAIGLTVWAVLVVGLVDHFLRPHLISRGTGLHPLVMLFAVLGGVTLFGPIGLIIGPIIMALMLALVHIWLRVITDVKKHSHRKIRIHS
jgi:predicted PurR-regulated permease PerM